MAKLEVIGLGAMNLDLFYSVERVVIDGETAVKSFTACPGGSAANTIYALAKLGVSTGFVGIVGNDTNGRLLLRSINSVGVDSTRIKTRAKAATGTVLAITDGLGNRALYVSPGVNNLLNKNDIDLDYLNQAAIVHISPFASEEQFHLQNDLVKHLAPSVKISFAPGALYASRGLAALQAILSRTHILFVNRDEIETLTGEPFQQAAETCLKQGCQQVVVTLGKGERLTGIKRVAAAFLRDNHRECFVVPWKSRKQSIVDATGAGDAFTAGFLYGFLKGNHPHENGLAGDLLARFSLDCLGARHGLPTLARLKQAYMDIYHKALDVTEP